MEDELAGYLNALVGMTCEGVDNPLGSVLRVDIGPLGLGPHDEPDSQPHGWRHLTVKCPWRLQTSVRVICDWNEADAIERSSVDIVGQRVQEVSVWQPGLDLRIVFANGVTMLIFADSTLDRDDAWFILGTDGFELVAGPAREGRQGWHARWVQ